MDLVHYLINNVVSAANNFDASSFLAASILANVKEKEKIEKIGECGKTKSECTVQPKLICLENGDCPQEQ